MTIPVCSFCKRPGPKVSYLVQGPDNLLICDNCVAASVDTVAKKDRGWRDRQIDHLLSLRNAEGPKTTLFSGWVWKVKHRLSTARQPWFPRAPSEGGWRARWCVMGP